MELEEALLDYMGENDFKNLKEEFPDNKWKYLTKKLAYPYEYFNSLDDYQKPVDNLKKNYCFSKLKNDCPTDEEKERTKEIIKIFRIKIGEELTQIYLKRDVLLITCVFEKFIKVSINEFAINPLYRVSQHGYTWQCGLNYTRKNLQTLQDKDMIFYLRIIYLVVFHLLWEIDMLNQMKIKGFYMQMLIIQMVFRCPNPYLIMKSKCGMVIQIFI